MYESGRNEKMDGPPLYEIGWTWNRKDIFLNEIRILLNRILDKFYFQKWEMVLWYGIYTRKALRLMTNKSTRIVKVKQSIAIKVK